jgi:hypothetical protein
MLLEWRVDLENKKKEVEGGGRFTFMIPILPLMVNSMSSYWDWDAMIV